MKAARQLFMGCAWLLIAVASHAQSVWHCSRQAELSGPDGTIPSSVLAANDSFQIASMSAQVDVIGITLRDLMDVYSGVPVRIGGQPLTACFNNDSNADNVDALSALGLSANAMSALSRKSAIVRSQLVWVSNEAAMMQCIARHFPAVGYLPATQDSSDIAPCF